MKQFLLLLIFIQTAVSAQQEILITGTIQDEQKNPVPFGNVSIHNPSDSVLITGGISDDHGKFQVPVKLGNYYVKVSFLSYQEQIIPNIVASQRNVDLGLIILKENTEVLDELVIKGEKGQMELQLDKRVFNIQKDLSNVGRNASDILGNLPSVTVDVDGTVSLRGSENVRILINGRPSGLTSRDPEALRMLQGNLIETVEIITNPSSRYDAAGEVGIINIVLKKNQEKGINGTFTGNVGYPAFYGGAYSINLRRNKTNIFSSYGVDYNKRPGYGDSYQRYSSEDTSFVYTQHNDRSGSELSHNFTIGLDYFLNDKNTITGSLLYNTSAGLNKATTNYNDFNENEQLTRTVVRSEREKEDEENIEGSLSYKKTFETKGRMLTSDFKWIKSVDNEDTDYREAINEGSDSVQRSINFADELNWLFQTDYIHPFGKEGKIEAGIKTATRIIKNRFGLESQDAALNWIRHEEFTNYLIYTERIHAAYIMVNNTFGKFSIQTGIRGELSDITTELTETNEVNPRDYFNVFPSASLSYKIRDNRTLQLSYSYRISRPDFRNLLPFSDFRDPRVLFTGNPNLRPEYTNSLEAGYLLDWEGGSILSNIYYRNRTDVIQRIVSTPDSTGRSRVIPINLANEDAYGIELNLSLNIQDWWRLNTSVNFYRAITKGVYEGDVLESDNYTWTSRTTSKMTLFKNVDFQASFNYRAPRVTTQGKDLSMYSIDLGISRDVLKGKGTLTANVRDLLNSRMRRSIIDRDDYYSNSKFQWRTRQFMLTFTYRLNQGKDKQKQKNDSQDRGEDEF